MATIRLTQASRRLYHERHGSLAAMRHVSDDVRGHGLRAEPRRRRDSLDFMSLNRAIAPTSSPRGTAKSVARSKAFVAPRLITGRSAAMGRVVALINQVAPTSST